ncbi:MAG: DUF928 domain-containing protein [Leptolyngbya sp. Prado105]|nr:DUF928 domain-containing protein [Leptolyngbya sp. Prado105]
MPRNLVQPWLIRSILVGLISSLAGWQSVGTALTAVRFEPPRGNAPTETKGGASRGDIACTSLTSHDTPQIVLLTPTHSNYSLTTLKRPTFLVYVSPSSAPKAFFSLKNAKGQLHYRQAFPVPEQGGIIRITLPDSTAPLAVNHPYEWGVALMCGGKLRPNSPFASSWVQRIQLASKVDASLPNQPALEQAAIYGSNAVWHDMLAKLATLKQQKPQDPAIARTWTQILDSAGLTKITSAEIVN